MQKLFESLSSLACLGWVVLMMIGFFYEMAKPQRRQER